MKSMRLAVLLLSIALVVPAFAASPNFKDWERSPQGYFMTKAEHQEWTAIRTQEEAQRFIDQFLAKRDPDFAAEVSARAQKADKYFTVGKLQGSKTLRGKIVIVFGPPSTMDVSNVVDTGNVHHDSPLMASAISGGTAAGGDGGKSAGGDDGNEGSRTMGGASIVKNYHLVYKSAPGGAIDVMISAESDTGKDRPADRNSSKQLDAAFEAAALASIKTK
ncbi:MAG TPA: GWxTD domain-containing protein [Thermoanaerobaculia bacterium]|jgi:GWxTD domain-containing protein|nr:GWxTD domain-containing protein [Thermoanaerobaculia bacterium]